MITTVTTRQYLESVLEKTDKHLTRLKQDENRLTTLIQSLETSQQPWVELKNLKSLIEALCKKYARKYTVGITACKSYYEKHGKLTNNSYGKFVKHQPIFWSSILEPEWREACRNMINVLFDKNKNQFPPLVFTITALKNLINHYNLYDKRGKLVENVQSTFAIIEETLNAPIPEWLSSQFIQNKIDSAKPVNRQQPTDRSDLLNLRQNTTTIGEWVENVKSKYDITKQMVYRYFKKFDIQPKAEMKKPFEDKDAIIEDLQKKVEELQKRLDAANTEIFTMETNKSDCDEWKDKCNNLIQENAGLKQTILELTQNNNSAVQVQDNPVLIQEIRDLKEANNKLKNDLTTANNNIVANQYQAKKIIEEKDNTIKKKQNTIDDLIKKLKKYEN